MGLRTVYIECVDKGKEDFPKAWVELPEIIFGDSLFFDLAFNKHKYSNLNFKELDCMSWETLVTKDKLLGLLMTAAGNSL